MIADAYPLQWPVGRPRTRGRRSTRFGVRGEGLGHRTITIAAALSRLKNQADMLGASDLVVSTNIPTRQDGLPFARARPPDDPGVAVYLRIRKEPHCLACDKWDTVAGNIAAIAAHINAIRGQARWGVGDLAQAFAGYKALPAAGAVKPWWQQLGFREPPESYDEVKSRWLDMIERHHPDHGGSANQAAEINAAHQQAKTFYQNQDHP